MAGPQLEDGYTRIANEVLEHMAKVRLTPTQYRILFIIWRYTYGFNRKTHHLSIGFLARAIECDERAVRRSVREMLDRRILLENGTHGRIRVLGFNKHFAQWVVEPEQAEGQHAATWDHRCPIGGHNAKDGQLGEMTPDSSDQDNFDRDNLDTVETTPGQIGPLEEDNSDRVDPDNSVLQEIHNLKTNLNTTTTRPGLLDPAAEDAAEAIRLFTELFGPPNSTHFEMINSFLNDGLTMWHIKEALNRAAFANAGHPNYILPILQGWVAKRAFTPEDVERMDKHRDSMRQKTRGPMAREDFTYSETSQDRSQFSFLTDGGQAAPSRDPTP